MRSAAGAPTLSPSRNARAPEARLKTILVPLLLAVAAPGATPARSAAGPAAPAPAPAAGRRETVEALVRRSVAAYGGEAALARAAVALQEGRVTSLLHPGQPGRIGRAYVRPGRLRVEIAWPDRTGEVRVLDAGRGWRDGQEVDGPRLAAMVLQAARLDVLALLSAPGAKVEDRGAGEVERKRVRILALTPAPGLQVLAEVELATGRVLRSRGSSLDPKQPLAFETTYGDFRTVDGVLVPFLERNWANGKTTGETILERVSFPKTLGPELFRP